MNTAELIEDVARNFGITKTLTKELIDHITLTIQEKVSQGEVVRLTGFGTFYSIQRDGRIGHNPQNGKKVKIPAKNIPKFRPGRHFKAALN